MDRQNRDRLTRRRLLCSGLATATTALLPMPLLARDKPKTMSYGDEKLDIYKAGQTRGAMIYVHGGAWRMGSRKNVNAKPDWCNAMGLDFISIDYPLLPKAPVKDQINSVRQAIEWVFRNHSEPAKTLVMGHSAGAHLAAMATLIGWSPKPAGVILNDSGALDLVTLARAYQGHLPFGTRHAFKDRDDWGTLSPAYRLARNMPPTLGIWSKARGHAMAMSNFATNMRGMGGDITLFDGSAYGHAELNRELGRGKMPDLEQAITRFMRKVL
ncbi:alpha/beta hydrolase [Celeribacter neptunius]|uniref:Alpha/beta hydrolase fold n=1 Tax=Celeribacter neptunius TaxID=588602 RepID=A0A1I3LMD5_9RHOB|nr:alpha/beta hydrolase [Celeribacter neptunius]SFI85710.1 alpha/beta hydrolase fold [Celeribacter neptunius]